MLMNQYLVTDGGHFCCVFITFVLYQLLNVYFVDFAYVVLTLLVISLIVLINNLG